MADFLLELRSEEIPARMQDKARAELERLFVAELAKGGLAASAITTYATPRRLALIARDLPLETPAVSEELKGPRAGAPPQALEGFLRKTGLAADQLVDRGGVLFAVIEKPGRATADVLAAAIPAIIRAFPWPKSMRWGDASASTESLRWVRPLQGIVAILGEELVPCEIAGIQSGCATVGHRFHSPHAITMGGAQDYVEKLRACHVIVDQNERRATIRDRAHALAADARLTLIEDEGLVAENAGLTEWPVPLLGRFDEAFLDVPPEVIQLSARVNQKYFVCSSPLPLAGGAGGGPVSSSTALADTPSPNPSRKREGSLANAFICVANIAAKDGGARIVEGNQKVLAARLSDARFFYETDLKVPLDEQAKKLEKIVFHEKLGTVADKVDRVAKLARWLVEEGIVKSPSRLREGLGEGVSAGDASDLTGPPPTQFGVGCAPGTSSTARGAVDPELASGRGEEDLATLAERAARLCKADLVTGMVGEFPELQGIMGGYYARAQGEDPRVADAIRDHYKPVGQGDEVPTAPVTVAVSLADKLDTLAGFFGVDLPPTGSKDPFGLRRAALGALTTGLTNSFRANWLSLLEYAVRNQGSVYESGELLIEGTIDQVAKTEQQRGPHALWLKFDKTFPGVIPADEFPPTDAETVFSTISTATFSVVVERLWLFLADRLKVQQREAGVRHDLIDAVFALGNEDDLVRLLARVHALQAFVTTAEGANLLAGYKRAANILKKEGYVTTTVTPAQAGVHTRGGAAPAEAPADMDSRLRGNDGDRGGTAPQKPLSYTPEPAETALMTALDSAEPRAAAAIAAEDFAAAMAALASLRAPIDAFFDSVIVNDPDSEKREARLALLDRMRAAVHTVADFSRIEG